MFRKFFPLLLLLCLPFISPATSRALENRLDAGLLVTEASVLNSRSSFRHGFFLEGSRDDRLGIQVAVLLQDWLFGPSIHEDNDPQLRFQAWYAIRKGAGGLGLRAHFSYDPPMTRSWQSSFEDEVHHYHSRSNWWRGALQARWCGDGGGEWRWIPSVELGVSRYSSEFQSTRVSGSERTETQPWAGARLELHYRYRIFMGLALALHGADGGLEIYGQARAGVRLF